MQVQLSASSLRLQQNLVKNQKNMQKNFERLSSGQQIRRASDDAISLALSQQMKTEMRGLQQVSKNALDGLALLDVTESGLASISSILARLRYLGVQGASDTIGDPERHILQIEYKELLEEIDRIANKAELNGSPLLNGQGEELFFQIGTKNRAGIDRISHNASEMDARTNTLGVSNTGATSKLQANESIEKLDAAINQVHGMRAKMGALQNRLAWISEQAASSQENLSAANSKLEDTDVAKEASELTKHQILLNIGSALLAQMNRIDLNAMQTFSKLA